MSFVMGNAQRTTIPPPNDTPGPAQYIPQIPHKHTEQAAPFNSSAIKQSTFDIPPNLIQFYNPHIPPKTHHITSSFASRVQRFPTTKPQPPLPPPSRPPQIPLSQPNNTISKLQKQNNKRKTPSISSNKEAIRIVLSNPHNSQLVQSLYVERDTVQKHHGPGSYNITTQSPIKGVIWSKAAPRQHPPPTNVPGPGTYSPHLPSNQRTHSASFSFTGVRSYLDEIIYRTRVPVKIALMKENHIQDRYPGPGQYALRTNGQKSFYHGSEQMGVLRGRDEQTSNHGPGPGFYNLQTQKIKRVMNVAAQVREKVFGKKAIRKKKETQTLQETNRIQVLKAQEQRQNGKLFHTLMERCTSKAGTLGRSNRFRDDKPITQPGPGQYKQLTINASEKTIGSVFASKTQRISSFCSKQGYQVPFYQTTLYDISAKALKIRANIEQLRQINCIRPPFDCGEGRLKTQILQKHINLTQYKQSVVQNKQNIPKATAAFISKTKRVMGESESTVGPGNYDNLETKWEKKSFNRQYKEKESKKKVNSSMRLHSL